MKAEITSRKLTRYFALGKGYSTLNAAARAIAKKELTIWMAVFVLTAEEKQDIERGDLEKKICVFANAYERVFGSNYC